jgi:sortase A
MLSFTQAKTILRSSRYVFFIAGILALGYVGFAIVDSRLYQAAEGRRFQQVISIRPSLRSGNTPLLTSVALAEKPTGNADSPAKDQADDPTIGRIEISEIGVSAMVLEGTDDLTLRRAVGHVSGTALPGQNGNVAIAGHRDTFFRGLRDIHKDIEIKLTTLKGTFRYRVDSTEVVDPKDADELDDSGDATLTLVTCYPFNFIGSAPRRFIVHASKVQ